VEGAEHVDPAGRYIFISNHQSHLDIPCLSSAIPCSIRYVAKRSLFRIPVFGQGLRSIGTVCVDRGNKQYSKRKMEEARRGIGQRVSLLFFAEGTRSRDGRLGPFKSGGVAMALALGIPVVPVAIAGTWAILPKGFHLVRPGPARVAIGKPIEPGPNTHARKEQLLHEVHDQVASLLERMDRTSGHRRAETRRAGRA
jgi:1-acyl-sn-glycerol-3-phosphate acyltransferase